MEPGMPGIIHVPHPYHGPKRGTLSGADALAELEEVIMLEGPQTIAGFLMETVTGTNGIHVPPDGYLEGVRALCDKHGILLIADEVMSGFGRTGEWFAIDHWKIVPDILVDGEGPDERVRRARRRRHPPQDRRSLQGQGLLRRPDLQQPSARLRRGARDDRGLRGRQADRAREVDGRGDAQDARGAQSEASVRWRRPLDRPVRHRRAGARIARRMEPLAPFNGTSPEMQALGKFFREEGLYTFVRWNGFFTNPPLCITEAELREAFAIIDKGLYATDKAIA